MAAIPRTAWDYPDPKLPDEEFKLVFRKPRSGFDPGHDGVIHIYTRKADGQRVIAKMFNIASPEPTEIRRHREIESHPSLVKHIAIKDMYPQHGMQTILNEFAMGKSLWELLTESYSREEVLPDSFTHFVLERVLEGILWMESQGFAPVDLDLRNVVFDQTEVEQTRAPWPKIVNFSNLEEIDTRNRVFSTTVRDFAKKFRANLVGIAQTFDLDRAYARDLIQTLDLVLSRDNWSPTQVRNQLMPRIQDRADHQAALPDWMEAYFLATRNREDNEIFLPIE